MESVTITIGSGFDVRVRGSARPASAIAMIIALVGSVSKSTGMTEKEVLKYVNDYVNLLADEPPKGDPA